MSCGSASLARVSSVASLRQLGSPSVPLDSWVYAAFDRLAWRLSGKGLAQSHESPGGAAPGRVVSNKQQPP